MQHAVDGVGGAEAGAAEEGVEVECLIVGMRLLLCGCRPCLLGSQAECVSIVGGGCLEPFVGEEGGDFAGGARDGGGETACAEGGAIDEEVELVGGGTAVKSAVEGDGEEAVGYAGRGDCDQRHRAFADNDVRVVYVALGGEAVFVEFAEECIGAVVLADSQPMEAYEVGFLSVRREFGDGCKGVAMRLLLGGLRVGYMGRHRALALPPVPGVVYLVAELAALGVSVFACHIRYLLLYRYNGKSWILLCEH